MHEDIGSAERRTRLATEFRRRVGSEPAVIARAPGRVELMGSHTDYNLCRVLTLPIGLDTWIVARPRADRMARLYSTALDAEATFAIDERRRASDWTDYAKGVMAVLASEGLALSGFDAIVDTTIPIGGGLSSSAAFECAVATACGALGGWTLEPLRLAQLCQRAENEFVGVTCGILDQYSASVSGRGGALLLDCRDLTSRPVGIAADLRVVVCDTRAKRELTGSEYGARRAQCEEGARLLGHRSLRDVTIDELDRHAGRLTPLVARRCRFIVEEDARAVRLADVLPKGERAAIQSLMAESFQGACDQFEIGAPAMVAMMRAMETGPGFVGGRQSGAGFGGCLVAIVDGNDTASFTSSVRAAYAASTGIEAHVFPVGAGAPAGLLGLRES